MPSLLRLALPPLAALALAGCQVGDRFLETSKQPVVSGTHASVPGCPDWSDAAWNTAEGNAANYGCATNSNLAAMVADKADLLHGKAAPTGADVAVRAIKAWRDLGPSGKGGIEKVSAKSN